MPPLSIVVTSSCTMFPELVDGGISRFGLETRFLFGLDDSDEVLIYRVEKLDLKLYLDKFPKTV